MKYEPVGNYVELSQGLAVNKGTASLFSGYKSEDFPYPLLRIIDFENEEKKNYSKYVSKDVSPSMLISKETIVFTRVTCQCFRGFEGVLHNNLFTVKLKSKELDEDYLYTILQSGFVQKQALNFAKSSVVPDLSHEMFKSIIIPIPSIETQRKIASVYEKIAKKINILKKTNDELVQMTNFIYSYWFMQYDFPDENNNPYRTSGGKMKWDEILKTEIPNDWTVLSVGEAANFENGDRGKNYPSGDDFILDGIPFINGGMISNNSIVGELKYISEEKYNSLRAGKAEKNDILLTLRGSIDKCVYSPFEKAAIASALVIIRPNGLINNTYLYHYLLSDYYKCLCANYDNGSVQANLSVDIVKSFPIIIPSSNILKKWDEIAGRMDATIEHNKIEIAELESYRDYILPLLMNGQVKVK